MNDKITRRPEKGALLRFLLAFPVAILLLAFGLVMETGTSSVQAAEMTVTGMVHVDRGYPLAGTEGSVTVSVLVDGDGQEWLLEISAEDALALDGATVAATGEQTGEGALQVSSYEVIEEAPVEAGSHREGSLKFATILCKFADVAAEPQPLSFFDDMMGSTSPGANHYWQEQSYGAMDLDGSIQRNWLDLPDDRSDYIDDDDPDNQGSDRNKLFDDCKQAHEDDGADFSGFFGINLIFNDDLDCCAWGGSRSGFAATWMPPWSWGDNDTGGISHGVLAQEMGHSFGLPHEGCFGTESPYDSNWDPMSSARFSQVHVNAAYKDDLHWIPNDRKYVADDSDNQTVRLERLAQPGDDDFLMAQVNVVSILNIPIVYYTIEARKAVGYDGSPSSLPSEGVVIHHVNTLRDDKNAQVVHNDPVGDDCNAFGDWQVGEYFLDEANGVRIGVIEEDADGFTISINGPVTDLGVTKTAPLNASAGELMDYHVSVVNDGPDTATGVQVEDVLPPGVDYVADTDSCVEAPAGTLTCTAPGPLFVGDSWDFDIKVQIDSDLVANSGGASTTITNSVSVTSDIPDQDFLNNTAELTTFVVAEADLKVTKDCKPDEPLLTGELGTCTILVDNLGPSMAASVVVTDTHLSEGNFSFGAINTDSGSCGFPVGGVVTCNLGNLDAGARATITVVVSSSDAVDINDCASATSDTPDPDTANNQACDGVAVVLPEADLRVTKDCKPDEPLLAGSIGTCTILVDNLGPQTAANVVVTDTHLSEGNFNFGAINTDKGACGAPSGGVVTCNLGNMAPGARATITVQVWANDAVDINDCASAVSDTLDPDNNNNLACDGVTVISLADLAITKVDIPDPVVAGTNLQYDITVTNNGPSTAINVLVADILPAEVSLVSVSSTGGGACNAGVPGDAAQPTTCTFDSMSSGASETMTVVVTVDPGFVGQLENDVTVSSDAQDDNNGNNLDTTTTLVNAEADLAVAKTDSPDPVNAGETVKYEVVITNNGPSVSQSVSLDDALPSEVAFVSATITLGNGACVHNPLPNTVTCNFTGGLNPSESLQVVIEGVVDPSVPDGTVITNTATASAATTDPAPGNDSASQDTTVNALADLMIEKDSTFEAGNASGNVIYIVTVTNNGPSDALNVVVVDEFPSTAKKFEYVFDTSNGVCSYDKPTHALTCNLGTLAAGESWTVEIHMNPKGNLGTVTNTATVSSDTADPDTSNNTVTKDVIVGGGTDGKGGPPPGRGRPK